MSLALCQSRTSSSFTNCLIDDVARAEAKHRIKSTVALPIHREMKKVHKEFIAKGGAIKVYCGTVNIVWNKDKTVIRSVAFDA